MKRKNILFVVVATLAVIAAADYAYLSITKKPDYGALYDSPENSVYTIEKNTFALTDGKLEQSILPGSATKIKTAIFGQPVYGDISNDGKADAVMFLSQDTGGSGIFYYAIAAVNSGGKYAGLNAIFLGDRIAPQTINIFNGVANVNYAIRGDKDPMTAQPSIGVTKYLAIKDGRLLEVPQPK